MQHVCQGSACTTLTHPNSTLLGLYYRRLLLDSHGLVGMSDARMLFSSVLNAMQLLSSVVAANHAR